MGKLQIALAKTRGQISRHTATRSNQPMSSDRAIKAIGFLGGQYGDAVMCQVACRQFKKINPNSYLTFAVSRKYEGVIPFLYDNESIDSYHVWEGYDEMWPTQQDALFAQNYDIVFNPMSAHKQADWFLRRHQTEEICHMFGIGKPDSTQIVLNKYFPVNRSSQKIALCPFAVTRGGEKSLSKEKVLEIESAFQKIGIEVVQVMSSNDEQICEHAIRTDFFSAIQTILGFDMAICVDTSIPWILSGYSFPTLGLYNPSYYSGAKSAANWQPTNKNALYIENSNGVGNISVDEILEKSKLF